MLLAFFVVVLVLSLYILGLHINNGFFEDFPQYSKTLGFSVESHKVITEDGYILTVFRLQRKGTKKFQRDLTPILFQHGLLDSADGWITNANFNSSDKARAFYFADRGFDVWVSNTRGNYYSRDHIRYDPDRDAEFWDYSFVEMGMKDVPAVFNYISNFTDKKIHYIGHSQGTAQMFAALAKREPTIVAKLNRFVALAPVVYVKKEKAPLFDAIGIDDAFGIWAWFGIHEVFTRGWFNRLVASALCTYLESVCSLQNGLFSNGDNSLANHEQIDVQTYHFPSGSSVKSLKHFEQIKQPDSPFQNTIMESKGIFKNTIPRHHLF